MRLGIICLMQESNTFISKTTEFQNFEDDLFLKGNEIRDKMDKTHHEVSGFFEGLYVGGIEAVPIFAARALPFGTISKKAFDKLLFRDAIPHPRKSLKSVGKSMFCESI